MLKKRKAINSWKVLSVVILILVILFLLYPLSKLFLSAFQDKTSGAFSLQNFKLLFSKPYYYKSLLNSIKVTAVVTILCMVIGIPMAYAMTTSKIRGKSFLEILIILSMMSPPFIGAYS